MSIFARSSYPFRLQIDFDQLSVATATHRSAKPIINQTEQHLRTNLEHEYDMMPTTSQIVFDIYEN